MKKESIDDFILRFDELVSDLELAGEKIDDYRCKMNFLQAIRMAYPDVVGKLEKNDLKNISLDCIKNNLRTHINDVQESSNRVENGSNEGDSNSIFYGASVDRGNSYRSRRGGNRYGHFRGKNGGVQKSYRGYNCHRCGKPGHVTATCRSKAWICYVCKKLTTTHKAATCRGRGNFRNITLQRSNPTNLRNDGVKKGVRRVKFENEGRCYWAEFEVDDNGAIVENASNKILEEDEGDALLAAGNNDESGKSTSGYAVYMFGDLISWSTKKQAHVALSSAEAEFVAMSVSCKEVISLKEMCNRLLNKKEVETIIYGDNKAAIKVATSEDSKTFKHMIGDVFTKALAKEKFEYFRGKLIKQLKVENQESGESGNKK
ncbi:hypothetical protein U1Q18_050920 [Sarracenia purpurea var. burkii]